MEKEDKAHAHTTLFKYFHPEPLPSPITKDIKAWQRVVTFHYTARMEGYAAVMTLRDGIMLRGNHCIIFPGATEMQSAACLPTAS